MRFGLPYPKEGTHEERVLNALRRQCDLDYFDTTGCVAGFCAQRLTATMRFGRGFRVDFSLISIECSTPYGDNAIWTSLHVR